MLQLTKYGFSFRKFRKAAAFIAVSACSITSVWAQCSVTAPNVQNICAGNALSITASTVAGATYTWTGPNSFSTTTTSPTAVISNSATTAMTGNYTVKVTVGGCTSPTVNSQVNVWGNIAPVISSAQCFQAGTSTTIAVGGSNLYNTYIWTTPSGYTMTFMSASTAGIFGTFATNTASQFSVHSENPSCPNSPTTTFTMYPKPQPTISAAKTRMCKDETVQLVASIPGGTWSITTSPLPALTGGATTQSTVNSTSGLFTGNNPGVFKVRYTVVTNGCTGFTEQDITVGALPFTITGPDKMCQYDSKVYTVVQPGQGNIYSWKVYQDPNTPISGPSVSNFNQLVATLNSGSTVVNTNLRLSATGAFECIAASGSIPAVYKYSDAYKIVTVVPSPSNVLLKCADASCNTLTAVMKDGSSISGLTFKWTDTQGNIIGTTATVNNPKTGWGVNSEVTNADGCKTTFSWQADYTLNTCNVPVYDQTKAWYCNQNYTTVNCPHPNQNARTANKSYQLIAYPNPASNNISFVSEGLEGSASIHGIDGVAIKTLALTEGRTIYDIHIATLQSGIYVLRVVYTNGQVYTTSIIKE